LSDWVADDVSAADRAGVNVVTGKPMAGVRAPYSAKVSSGDSHPAHKPYLAGKNTISKSKPSPTAQPVLTKSGGW